MEKVRFNPAPYFPNTAGNNPNMLVSVFVNDIQKVQVTLPQDSTVLDLKNIVANEYHLRADELEFTIFAKLNNALQKSCYRVEDSRKLNSLPLHQLSITDIRLSDTPMPNTMDLPD